MSIRVVTDSTCDLPPDIVQKHAVTVVPLYINIGAASYLDGIDITRQAFYTGLPDYQPFPTTAVPGPGQFVDAYSRLADEGATDILSIHISPALSAVVNSARLAAETVKTARVTVVDSGQLSLGLGFMVQMAAQAAADGRSLAEILALLDDLRGRAYVFAVLNTTEYLYRSGRVTGFQNGLGTLLQIKPILKMHNGKAESEKIRSSKMAARRLVDLALEIGPLERLALVHTNNQEGARRLWEANCHQFPTMPDPIDVNVTPVIGAHIGPGAVGFACLGERPAPRGKVG